MTSSTDVQGAGGAPTERQAKEAAEPAQPFADGIQFNLSIPPLETRLVDATVLEEYEIWIVWSSLLFSGFIGFLVAFIQSVEGDKTSTASLVICLFLALLTAAALIRVVLLRRRLVRTSTKLPMLAVAKGAQPSGEERGKPAPKRDSREPQPG
ncbi:MAG TPA: hypothetical protein VHF89_07755 [Solirubrobacteraceae bacterium]|nr:hypothetical protein [Solirubrobacteraceae bacterium]